MLWRLVSSRHVRGYHDTLPIALIRAGRGKSRGAAASASAYTLKEFAPRYQIPMQMRSRRSLTVRMNARQAVILRGSDSIPAAGLQRSRGAQDSRCDVIVFTRDSDWVIERTKDVERGRIWL